MSDSREYIILRELARLGAHEHVVILSTEQLGRRTGMSQQSASRWLRVLHEKGMIIRERNGRNLRIRLSPTGTLLLKREHAILANLFENSRVVELQGEVIRGLGEGRYYIMKEGYRKQIVDKLLFNPYPGTLNVRIFPKYREEMQEIRDAESLILDGFEENGRKYGRVRAYFATINDYPSALIFPEMSHYTDVIEIISDVYLRDRLALKDGAEVEIKVYL